MVSVLDSRSNSTALCSWERHFALIVPLYTQVYKWVPANLLLGVTLLWTTIPSRGGVEILLVASYYGNRDKLQPDGPPGSNADLNFTQLYTWMERGTVRVKCTCLAQEHNTMTPARA